MDAVAIVQDKVSALSAWNLSTTNPACEDIISIIPVVIGF